MSKVTLPCSLTALIILFAAFPAPTHACGFRRARVVRDQDSELVWKQLQARQKKTKRYAIVIEYALDLRAHAAQIAALRAETLEMRELLGAFEIACLKRSQMSKVFKDIGFDDNCLLVSPDGKLVASTHLDLLKLNTPKRLNQSLVGFIAKADGFRLAEWSKQSEKALNEDKLRIVSQALQDLDAEHYKQRRSARKTLTSELPRIAPMVFQLRCSTKSVEVKTSCTKLLAESSPQTAAAILGLPGNRGNDDDT